MKYIVDGYNLIFGKGIDLYTRHLEDARKKVLEELNAHAELFSLDIVIVFDAPMSEGLFTRNNYFSLEVVYTGKGESADAYILSLFTHSGALCSRVTVVTSDRALASSVRSLGAETVSVMQFIKMLRKKRQKVLFKKKSEPIFKKKELLPSESPEKTILKPKRAYEGLPPLMDIAAWEEIFEEQQKIDKNSYDI